MSTNHFRTAALALTLLAGTTAFAFAQSSSKESPSGATQMQKAPASQSGGMSKEQAAPDKATNGQKGTTGQNETDKSTQSSPSSSQKGMNAQEKGQTGSQPSTKGTQSTSQPLDKNMRSGSQPSSRSTQNGADRNNRSTTAAAPSGGQANLTTQQKTVIKTKIIDNKSAPRVSHVDFNVSVGVAVPTTVRLAPVPAEIVRIHPAWKSYEYFVYEEEVIIVNPRTHKIIEVITVS